MGKVDFLADGCPNDCSYCEEHDYVCIYKKDRNGKVIYNHTSPLMAVRTSPSLKRKFKSFLADKKNK